jgi:Zn-dependent protease
MRFEQTEIKDLLIAWILISVAFAIALRNTEITLLTQFLISAVTVGVGFVVHELAHKFVAQHYGKHAAFKASFPMLIASVVIAFSGIVIAAPGAVVISGFVNREENGIISAAGPLSNIVLALLFIPIFLFAQGQTLLYLASTGFLINSWLALFNMIPFGFFDGAKILNWNKAVYAAITGVSVLLVFAASMFFMPIL